MDRKVLSLVLVAFMVDYAICTDCTCWFPKQLEGMQGVSSGLQYNGTGIAATAFYNISWDLGIMKGHMNGTLSVSSKAGQQTYVYEILQDLKTNMMYEVTNGKCAKKPIKDKIAIACIPSNAKKVLSTFYGIGDKKIGVDIYNYVYEGIPRTTTVTNISDGKCLPVGDHIVLENGFYDIGYMGWTEGIRDPSVFNIPKQCLHLQ